MDNTQDDANLIRSKRLAKLSSLPPTQPSTSSPTQSPPPAKPKTVPSKPIVPSQPASQRPVTPVKKAQFNVTKFDLDAWQHETIRDILGVTLDRDYAEKHNYQLVWLKHLQVELESEDSNLAKPIRLYPDIADRLLIARLEVDPEAMSDDLDYVSVLASLPAEQTIFEYLVGCWKRHNAAKATLLKKNYAPQDTRQALDILDKLRDLIISYTGLTLQEPDMFSQPRGKPVGPPELVSNLLSLSVLSGPLYSTHTSYLLSSTEIPQFLADITQRFDDEEELKAVLGPVVLGLSFQRSLVHPDGIAGASSGWRGVIGGLEALVSIKPIAIMITKLPEWNPPNVTGASLEFKSIMGPLLRLSVYHREWPSIAQSYFSDPEQKTRSDVESAYASLRGTLKSFQASVFNIFNTFVRASAEAREAVLQYLSRAISLNIKRASLQVDPNAVASDGFMHNLQIILLRFAEPFMDATYSRIDKIDPLYLARSTRVDVKEETRIKATSDEVVKWAEEVAASGDAPANFISDIFYLMTAVTHYGLIHTLHTVDDLHKNLGEMQRHVDYLTGTLSTINQPVLRARTEAAINGTKGEMTKIHLSQLAYQAQLLDPEFVYRQVGFTNFLETWLIRLVDPKKAHPNPTVQIPLPQEIPTVFRMLPEYFLEDVVDVLLFLMRGSPSSLELSGKSELIIWALTFLRSSWYIKNPFLKAKINEVIFYGTLSYGREQNGVLGAILNTHPVALQHLMPAMMSFYIEVEQTGASSQFYDKFNARRNIAYILKAIWNNQIHREALNTEAKNVDKFVRFVNLMINDVTYLLDESLSEMIQIANIQNEMDQPDWQTKPLQHRREREGQLRGLERHASGYTTLGRSTVDLLKIFTAETKAPFMMPEIVDRLAAMLDYNLDALAGPRCQDLKVKEPEKYSFNPRALLSDLIQVYLNLSDQGDFVKAVAGDGRSYSKELFERAAGIAFRRGLKTEAEIEQLRLFVVKVEEMRATIEAEEDLGEVPDEFLDPLMFTIMRNPVTLPSSRTIVDLSTIKSHLLSDNKDPFNRVPLSIEEVIPNLELKAKIEKFLVERRNKNTALDIAEEEVVKMEIS